MEGIRPLGKEVVRLDLEGGCPLWKCVCMVDYHVVSEEFDHARNAFRNKIAKLNKRDWSGVRSHKTMREEIVREDVRKEFVRSGFWYELSPKSGPFRLHGH